MTFKTKEPYVKLDPTGDFVEQGGVLYAWSDSNVQYEPAWWLAEGVTETPLVKHLRETRKPRTDYREERNIPA